MLRIEGDMGQLIQLAVITDTIVSLANTLEYLNKYGDDHKTHYLADMKIFNVDLNNKESHVIVELKESTGNTLQVGLLHLDVNSSQMSWSVRT